jgi:hypothetical protein
VTAPAAVRRPPTAGTHVGPAVEAGPDRLLLRWLRIGALGAASAGGLHLAVAAGHVGAGDLTVGFFLLTAFAQLGLAAWLLLNSWTGSRPGAAVVTLALAATVGLIGLYVVAHTTGLLDAFTAGHGTGAESVGGHGGTAHDPGIDPVTGVNLSDGVAAQTTGPVSMAGDASLARHEPGLLGSWTVAAEALTIAALAALQPAAWRRRTTNAALVLGVLAWGLWFTGVLA